MSNCIFENVQQMSTFLPLKFYNPERKDQRKTQKSNIVQYKINEFCLTFDS